MKEMERKTKKDMQEWQLKGRDQPLLVDRGKWE